MPANAYKNIVYNSTILATGNIIIGDVTYIIQEHLQESILFLQIQEKEADNHQYTAQLYLKSPHRNKGNLQTANGQPLLVEPITLEVSTGLLQLVNLFQENRRGTTEIWRTVVPRKKMRPEEVENQLIGELMTTFFAGDIGTVCQDFVDLLHHQKLEELLLVVAADAANIRNLPWEMCLQQLRTETAGTIALNNTNFGLIRTTGKALDRFDLKGQRPGASPLKLLFITALPEDLSEKSKLLEIEDEQKKLIQAIGGLEATSKPKIVIEFLDNASLEEIESALTARRHDIVHISGHGSFDAKVKKGVLYLEDEEGNEEQISGKALGEQLSRHNCIRLLILSACETAIAGIDGTGEQLAIASGIPAILGMRFAVTDKGAKAFTTVFYERLAKGETLTVAIAEAREKLWQNSQERRRKAPQIPYPAEWFTPVLYQNQYVAALTDETAYKEEIRSNFYPQLTFLKGSHTKLVGQGFIGRKGYLIRLRKAFAKGRSVCLHGLGGLGKTTLAEAFSDNYRKRHGHLLLLFRGSTQINEKIILDELLLEYEDTKPNERVLRKIKAAMESNIQPTEKLQILLDNYLQGRKTILIFDNFEDVQTTAGERYPIEDTGLNTFITYFIQHAPSNCHLLFTTRYSIAGLEKSIQHIPLDKMTYAEQYRYMNFSEVLRGIPIAERAILHRRLDGHPRSLEYLEGFKRNSSSADWKALQTYIAQTETKVFDNLLLEQLYAKLPDAERLLLQQASILITRSPLGALAVISEQDEATLAMLLQNLQDWSLCFWDAKHKELEVHALTREWLRQQQQPDSATVRKYALTVGGYFRTQRTWNDELLARDYFEIAEAWDKFANATFRLSGQYRLTGFYEKALRLNEEVLEKPIGEKDKAHAWNEIGLIWKMFGHYDKALAYYQKCLVVELSGTIAENSARNRRP